MVSADRYPDPECIGCHKLAADMEELDYFWMESEEDADLLEDQKRAERVDYVRHDGTYNAKNGHFACDACYIAMGQPSSPTGWKAP